MPTYDDVVVVRSLGPAARTATANGSAVDTVQNGGMQDVVLVVDAGTVTDGDHAITVQESADGSTGWAAVAAGNVRGTLPTLADDADEAVTMVEVRPTKRYVRAVSTVTGSPSTGGVYSATFILGAPRFKPVSHS
ncbi:hypothetical protein [Actinomadura sp. SCN-SB]|uniref:hypothetical protein n=1 Tax=Actinomadura sp. SCN-SB TaxID=3373092 RepID=UPI00374FFE69